MYAALLLAMIATLGACGGNTAETTDVPVAGDVADAAGTEVSGEEPVAEAVPTEEPPATEPVEAPTELPPTEAPPSEPPPTEPPPTEEAPAETTGLDLPEGLCANPYFPVIEGRRLTYQSEVPGIGASTISFMFTNVTPSSFEMNLFTDGTNFITYTWQCFEDGILAPSAQLNAGVDVSIETIEASGLTFPNPEDVNVGHTWNTHYVMQTTVPDTGAGTMIMQQTMDMVNEIVAIEPVSTAYGDFDEAVKVETSTTMNIVTSMGDVEMPATSMDLSSTTWYAEGIGRVRSEDLNDFFGTGDAQPAVTELVAIE